MKGVNRVTDEFCIFCVRSNRGNGDRTTSRVADNKSGSSRERTITNAGCAHVALKLLRPKYFIGILAKTQHQIKTHYNDAYPYSDHAGI